MTLTEILASFEYLGSLLRQFGPECPDEKDPGLVSALHQAGQVNPWFTPENVSIAFRALGDGLTAGALEAWIAPYKSRLEQAPRSLTVGVVMAGNIPAVGFHDFLTVLVSGNKLLARLSSSDPVLLHAMAEVLIRFHPAWKERIQFTQERLSGFDAVIATGSSNTTLYFEQYFGKYPHIIRGHRNSVAVLTGRETDTELAGLADDIMLYFGMGCRSISKIHLPADYDFSGLIHALGRYTHFTDHSKYRNNYDYQKSVHLVAGLPFIDAGMLLLTESERLASPVAVVHYQPYRSSEELSRNLLPDRDGVQCISSSGAPGVPAIPLGMAQKPGLADYADGVDTLNFLLTQMG